MSVTVDLITAGHAAIVAAGGIIGYVRSGSKTVLATGIGFGGVLAYGSYQISQNPEHYGFTLVTSAAVALVTGVRCYRTRRFFPPGLVSLLSVLMVVRYGSRHLGIRLV